MKYIIFIFLILPCFLSSCVQEVIDLGCGDKNYSSFTQTDSVWLPSETDSIYYLNKSNDNISWKLYEYKSFYINEYDCHIPIFFSVEYGTSRKQLFFAVSAIKSKDETKINYSFNQTNDNLVPITSQPMGIIDIRTNQAINTESNQQVLTTKLGTHQIGEKTYENVFVIEDLDESNVPEIDISRFYVNPSGILRIEFYDGEVWTRVD